MDKITSTTAKITKASVQAAICSWNIRFPECNRDGNILDFLSREYFEDLESENVSMDEFSAACKVVRKNCTYFPKVAEILEVVRASRSKIWGLTF